MNSLNKKISFGWNVDTNTHSFITKKAVDEFCQKSSAQRDFFTIKDKYILSAGSQQPDYDDEKTDYTGHFYNPVTKKSYKDSDITGKDSFRIHAQTALDLYSKDRSKSVVELGKACHFLQDATQPYHINTTNKFDFLLKLLPHTIFEDYVGINQNKYNMNKQKTVLSDSFNKNSKSFSESQNYENFLGELFENTAKTTYNYNQKTKDSAFTKGENLLNFSKEQTEKFLERFKIEAEKKNENKNLSAYSFTQDAIVSSSDKKQTEPENNFINYRNDTAKSFRNVIFSLTNSWIKFNNS